MPRQHSHFCERCGFRVACIAVICIGDGDQPCAACQTEQETFVVAALGGSRS